MADNVVLNEGSGGDTIAADDVSGVKYQVVKIAVGGDGSATLVGNAAPVPVSDAGSSLTVDGTVTANLSAVDNAVLDAIQAATEAIETAVEGTLTIDTTGLATSANQTTIAEHLDGVETLLGTIDADTSALAGAVKAEDSAHQSGDSGIMSLFVRQDSQSDLGADGDYIPATIDGNGGLRVSIVSGAGSGGTSAADDADFTAESTQGTPAMGVYESTPSPVTDGDLGIVGITENRALKVHIESYADAKVDDATYTAGTDVVAVIGGVVTSDSVDSGDAGAVAMTTGRALHVAVQSSSTDAHVARGSSHHRNIDANAKTEIKSSAGVLKWIHAINLTDAIAYLHLYDNTAANVTPGTTTPSYTFPIPTSPSSGLGSGFVLHLNQAFANGITYVVTTTTDGSAGDPGTNGVFINAGYV